MNLYVLNQDIESTYNKVRAKYIFNKVSYREGILKFDDILHSMLIYQLKDYVEQEIATSTCYYLALRDVGTSHETLCFHAEHAIVRICSFWEHLFQILNTYLDLKMVPAKRLAGIGGEKWELTNFLNFKKLKWKFYQLNPLIKKQIQPKTSYLSRYNVIKLFKKMYVNDNHLRPLIIMSNSDLWTKLRDIRNDIVHYKFLRQRGAVNLVREDLTGILFEPKDKTVDHVLIADLLSKGLEEIYSAIEISYKIIRQDLVPPRKSTGRTDFAMVKVICNCSSNLILIPKDLVELENKLGDNPYRAVFCPTCFSDKITITAEEYKVSEDTFKQTMGHYIVTLWPNYMEKKTKELEV